MDDGQVGLRWNLDCVNRVQQHVFLFFFNSSCNWCMLHRTILPLGGANSVLGNNNNKDSKCINLCYCCYRRLGLLTKLHGTYLRSQSVRTKCLHLHVIVLCFLQVFRSSNYAHKGKRGVDFSYAISFGCTPYGSRYDNVPIELVH